MWKIKLKVAVERWQSSRWFWSTTGLINSSTLPLILPSPLSTSQLLTLFHFYFPLFLPASPASLTLILFFLSHSILFFPLLTAFLSFPYYLVRNSFQSPFSQAGEVWPEREPSDSARLGERKAFTSLRGNSSLLHPTFLTPPFYFPSSSILPSFLLHPTFLPPPSYLHPFLIQLLAYWTI